MLAHQALAVAVVVYRSVRLTVHGGGQALEDSTINSSSGSTLSAHQSLGFYIH